MSREKNGYFLGPTRDYDIPKYYERDKEYHIQEGSVLYGAVLVETKPVVIGFHINIEIEWWFIKYRKKPKFYRGKFEWLFLILTFSKNYHEQYLKTVRDHLGESLNENQS
jgi:hypothetical protein